MIKHHSYRKLNTAIMMPSIDTVCPHCRHVFPISPISELVISGSTTPPVLPPKPKLKSQQQNYVNVTPQPSSTTSSPNSATTKSYVTMSNLNISSIGSTSGVSNSANIGPSFVPVTSPTCSTAPVTLQTPITPSLSQSSTRTRVYRQLSGGGLIEPSDRLIRIHEPLRMHQLSGGGLVNSNDTNSNVCDQININISLPNTQLPLSWSVRPVESKSTKLLCSNSNLKIDDFDTLTLFSQSLPPVPSISCKEQVLMHSSPVSPQQYNVEPICFKMTQSKSELDDMQCLIKTTNCLKESGWFHEGLSWNDSETLLSGTPDGTFIVRESSNPNFLFAITVQTTQEPTSVRIQYEGGRFRLDCVSYVTHIVPQFECLVDLIEYYVTKHQTDQNNKRLQSTASKYNLSGNQVFVDENGHVNSIVSLKNPLRSSVPSLMHCARLAINKQLRKNLTNRNLKSEMNNLELPSSLKKYLLEYPYIL